jgi:hypothetical protein
MTGYLHVDYLRGRSDHTAARMTMPNGGAVPVYRSVGLGETGQRASGLD